MKRKLRANKKKNPFVYILKVFGGIIITVLAIFISLSITNSAFALSLNASINNIEPVSYNDDRLVPYIDSETGFYTIKTDREVKILNLCDLHLGGGLWTPKQDNKLLYEVSTILHEEKPDLVILNGDNIFAIPGPVFGGGGTLNNRMCSQTIINFFEKHEVYYTTTFGNHETEAFDYFNRQYISDLYSKEKNKYCIYKQDFKDNSGLMPSISNQCIVIKNNDNSIRKVLMLIDSNSYKDNSIMSSLNWNYDTIHDSQVDWASRTIANLSEKNGDINNPVKSLFFFHIPIGEFEVAYKELENNNWDNTINTEYIEGVWNEVISEKNSSRIIYGGCGDTSIAPENQDGLFEALGPDGLNSMEGCFCGHDHFNNAVVKYKGVILSYGNTLDNIAYDNVCCFGKQRGSTVINIENNGSWTQQHKNAYLDYHCSTTKFYNVDLEHYYNDDVAPSIDKIK